MTIFKFKAGRNDCPATMEMRSCPGGPIVREFRCRLPRDHEGPHRGDGLTWNNNTKFLEDLAREVEGPSKGKLFLPTK
jgi:hypothetical protein